MTVARWLRFVNLLFVVICRLPSFVVGCSLLVVFVCCWFLIVCCLSFVVCCLLVEFVFVVYWSLLLGYCLLFFLCVWVVCLFVVVVCCVHLFVVCCFLVVDGSSLVAVC